MDGHRRLAHELFADLPDDVLDGFDAGLSHVVERLRRLTAQRLGEYGRRPAAG